MNGLTTLRCAFTRRFFFFFFFFFACRGVLVPGLAGRFTAGGESGVLGVMARQSPIDSVWVLPPELLSRVVPAVQEVEIVIDPFTAGSGVVRLDEVPAKEPFPLPVVGAPDAGLNV